MTEKDNIPADETSAATESQTKTQGQPRGSEDKPEERGGPKGPEPTRYGDWEQKGRCTDF